MSMYVHSKKDLINVFVGQGKKNNKLIHSELNIYLKYPPTLHDLWKFISTIFIFIRHILDIFLRVSRII